MKRDLFPAAMESCCKNKRQVHTARPKEEGEKKPLPLKAGEVLYAQVDGAMLLTRSEGWKEVKQGRVFCESDCLQRGRERGWIKQYHYEAYLGESKLFTRRFEAELEAHGSLQQRLVFITDGALWMRN